MIADVEGTVLGEHEGLPFFTVGQRAGLGIPPSRPDAAPRYVVELLPELNRVVVGPREALRCDTVLASSFSWIAGGAPPAGTACQAQLRAHGNAHPARIERNDAEVVEVSFDTPVDQAAPGQSLVLYRGDEILGGGIVRRAA